MLLSSHTAPPPQALVSLLVGCRAAYSKSHLALCAGNGLIVSLFFSLLATRDGSIIVALESQEGLFLEMKKRIEQSAGWKPVANNTLVVSMEAPQSAHFDEEFEGAHAKLYKVEEEQNNACLASLPYKEATYDSLTSICEQQPSRAFLENAKRLIKSGGRVGLLVREEQTKSLMEETGFVDVD